MSIFERMDRVTSQAVDRTYSIRFHCDPMTSSPNGHSRCYSSRSAWEGKGVLNENPSYPSVELHTLVTGQNVELSVDRHRYPDAASAKQGDRFVMDDMRRFKISSVKPDGMARIVFILTAAGGAE